MSEFKLEWDQDTEKLYETGVDRGVLYVKDAGGYGNGVAWNGLSKVSESPSGGEPTALYANNKKYLELMSAEEFGGTIEAYMYPDEFAVCDGSASIVNGVFVAQQSRSVFGLTYRTKIGNDVSDEYGSKIHLVYGAKAKPSSKEHTTVNDSPEATTMSWEFSTTAVDVPGMKPTAHIIIDSTKVSATALAALENILYGTNSSAPRLPLPSELIDIFGSSEVYSVTNMLTNVENSNTSVNVTKSGSYDATLAATAGNTIASVVVMMNGVDVTEDVYTSGSGAISISSVAGPITIFATANTTAAG